MSSVPFLYPHVTQVPPRDIEVPQARNKEKNKSEATSQPFENVLQGAVSTPPALGQLDTHLAQPLKPIKFSSHAVQRLRERQIQVDSPLILKLNEAFDCAQAKGIEDSLVLTKDLAMIVNVKNRTVITAIDRGSITNKVFTNIDGAVLV